MENTTVPMVDYSTILDTYGVTYVPSGYYWMVGDAPMSHGWILHLSVISIQIEQLLKMVVPALLLQKATFYVIRDWNASTATLDGSLGYSQLGKIVSIYPETDEQCTVLAVKLIELTKPFRGPHIPSAFHLGGLVYACHRTSNTVPYVLHSTISWPFSNIIQYAAPRSKKLLNSAYYPIHTLKPDAKGHIIKALHFEKFWKIRSCIIKQGRKDMFTDEHGRNIQDRLQWQYELHKALAGVVPLPKIFDYFGQDGDTYLAMEFVNGMALNDWINNIYINRCWTDLNNDEQFLLLDRLTEILLIIEKLHRKGYIHRDITPENFLIDRKLQLTLIDMELAWSSASEKPWPPFRLGTHGFMSPEQFNVQRPTTKEDIYGLGALMVVFFTSLTPEKFSHLTYHQLTKDLYFFTREPELSKLIASCLHPDPNERPHLKVILDTANTLKENLLQGKGTEPNSILSSIKLSELKGFIQCALDGLANPRILTPKYRWASDLQKPDLHIGNLQMDLSVVEGWYTGMAGPLYLVAKTKLAGFNINSCQTPYDCSWDYINTHYFKDPEKTGPGLFMGSAGIAMAFVEGIKSGLLPNSDENKKKLKQCFSKISAALDLSEGIAGQGIALLNSLPWLDPDFANALMDAFIVKLVTAQQPDGSWKTYENTNGRRQIAIDLEKGVGGITWFLLNYYQHYNDSRVRDSVDRSLDWLLKHFQHKNYPTEHIPGVMRVFIKASEVIQDTRYKKTVDVYLRNTHPRPNNMNFSLASGLSGLGELYLDAFNTFNNREWKQRADWICNLLFHASRKEQDGTIYWVVNLNNLPTADLFTGNSGIIHFFIRYLSSPDMGHPFFI